MRALSRERMNGRPRARGFTLMELMVVLALGAVILSLGVPSFNQFQQNSRITGLANDMLGGVQSARSEAIKRQVPVAVCPSDDPTAANATCTAGTFRGWITFVDPNNDCERDAADPDELVLRTGARIDTAGANEPMNAVSNGVCVSFAANGFLQTIPGRATASRTMLCDKRGNTLQAGTTLSAARGLEVSRTGRTRINRELAVLNAWPVACP
jgi:type IV fimbrial biogenesis protein FimT